MTHKQTDCKNYVNANLLSVDEEIEVSGPDPQGESRIDHCVETPDDPEGSEFLAHWDVH
jgi:hypothetical protein